MRAIALPLVFSVAILTVPSPVAAQDIPLVGLWRFEPELSTRVDPPPREGRRPQGQRPAGGPPGGGGGGGMGRGGGMAPGGMSDKERLKIEAVMRRVREAPQQLTITHDGVLFVFADDLGRSWRITTDGRKQVRVTGDGEIESRARMDGNVLVVDEDSDAPIKLHYRYAPEPAEGARRLRVTITMTGGPDRREDDGRPREITRVYTAAP